VTPRIRGADEIEASPTALGVFDRDLDFEDEYRWFHARDPQGWARFKDTFLDRREPATGRPINFAPLGSALLWSPFYLLAHAGVTAPPLPGVERGPRTASPSLRGRGLLASALFGRLGLLPRARRARSAWGASADSAAALAVAALWLARPVPVLHDRGPGLSHACSLFAVALLLWLWLRAAPPGDASLAEWAAVGGGAGLAGLVREPGPAVRGRARGRPRLARVRERPVVRAVVRLALVGAAAVAAFVPQLWPTAP
jgi:hypothetical protein